MMIANLPIVRLYKYSLREFIRLSTGGDSWYPKWRSGLLFFWTWNFCSDWKHTIIFELGRGGGQAWSPSTPRVRVQIPQKSILFWKLF